jgi:hypothetical protein
MPGPSSSTVIWQLPSVSTHRATVTVVVAKVMAFSIRLASNWARRSGSAVTGGTAGSGTCTSMERLFFSAVG